MTKHKLNEHKANMDKITEKLGGTRNDIWQDQFIYEIAECLREILIDKERESRMQTLTKIAYICDCKKSCANFESCQVNCFHTLDEFHAKNGVVHDILELKSSRFEKIGEYDEMALYIGMEVSE